MNEHVSLVTLLNAVRTFLDLPSTMTNAQLKQARKYERLLADRVMFNAGWHAAQSGELNGSASTKRLAPALFDFAEYVRSMVSDPKVGVSAGRKKGSYKSWHFDPGYLKVTVDAAIQPNKTLASHIRQAVKDGWLKKSIPDNTHARRIRLIQKRWAEEDAERLKSLGKNVVILPPRKRRRK